MCGIAGIFNFKSSNWCENKTSSIVSKMTQKLINRGPDDLGLKSSPDNKCVLGHRRLSIIDLDKRSAQPMNGIAGSIVFNGEIYNYLELKEILDNDKVILKTTSDTEILLKTIECKGFKHAISQCNGMFAIAYYHNHLKKLYLCRDRVGKKPLFIYKNRKLIAFSSEIKSFLGEFNLSINYDAIIDFMSLGYITGDKTIYNEIKRLKPGIVQEYDFNGDSKQEHYNQYFGNNNSNGNESLNIDYVEELLLNATRLRLRSDVPVGIFLSGGIDSGLLTALASSSTSNKLNTFTAKFSGEQIDESSYAKKVANQYSTNHTELLISSDLYNLVPEVASYLDEPFGDPSVIPTYAISKLASKHVKVVLNGEGSDEIFCGYRRYNAVKIYNILEKLKLGRGLLFAQKILKLKSNNIQHRSKLYFLNRLLNNYSNDKVSMYIKTTGDYFDQHEIQRNLNFKSNYLTKNDIANNHQSILLNSGLNYYQPLDFMVGMSDCLLVKLDMCTMANSLEARCPFLDYELIKYVIGCNRNRLSNIFETKKQLRILSKKFLPSQIVSAPKKGFEIPLKNWMNNELKEMRLDICLENNNLLFDLFDKKYIKSIVNSSNKTTDKENYKLQWLLFMLANWNKYSKK
ncbi:asparagine synthase (glutamine-hydrolyzing) [bacterium]|nr:asparagine synthase (glutamine-hydrolyzing) [bacterium]